MTTGTGMAHIERPHEGASNDWWTPPELVKALGEFDLDPCAGVGQPLLAKRAYSPPWPLGQGRKRDAEGKIVPVCIFAGCGQPAAASCGECGSPSCVQHNSAHASWCGLWLPWEGCVFCNPPYGPHVGIWADRMAQHCNGVLLIFARVETKAWRTIWTTADAILFPFRRITFQKPDGSQAKSGTAPSAFVAYGLVNVEALRHSGIEGALVEHVDITTTEHVDIVQGHNRQKEDGDA